MTRPELRVALDWFCGCGSPDDAAKTLLDILEMHPLYSNRDKFEKLVPDDGLQYVLLYALDSITAKRPEREGWFEHGGTVGGQWLTPEGERVRAALRREYELDPDEYGDRFAALFAPHCVHGHDIDDESHDCMAADDPA
jgi:hypothetical protein